MSLIEIFRAIGTNISSNKFRVFLTSLGIIVGSLTIILVVGIGNGSQQSVEEQFASLNVGTLYVQSPPNSGGSNQATLTPKDLESIREKSTALKDATITVSGKGEISYYQSSYPGGITGVTENFKDLSNLQLAYGQFISNADNIRRHKITVLGWDLAESLFEDNPIDAIGKFVSIEGRKYEVVGVLSRLGDSLQNINIDETALLPYEVATSYVLGSNVKPRIIAVAKEFSDVPIAINEITRILRENHKGGQGSDFTIRDAGSKLAAAEDSARTMSILLISVAAIVLIVGGIGIMNVLFVSVKERTREIGILKALGARKQDILLQFLLESIIISATGGLLGVLLSMAITPLMKYIDIRVIPSMYGNIISFGFAIVTGTFFGYYPAAKAASLKPIDALRYE